MGRYDKIKNFVGKLQNLPENQRKTIFFTIIAILAVILLILGVKLTLNDISKIGASLQSAEIPKFNSTYLQDNTPDAVVQNTSPVDQTKTVADQNPAWQIYKNEKYGFAINYPEDWKVDSNQTNDLHLWLQKQVFQEVASLHIEVASQTAGIKTTQEGVSYITSQMKDILKQERIKIGEVQGHEVIGLICTQVCRGLVDNPYFPFSVISFSDNDTVIKVKYSEGTLGSGWKKKADDWKYYNEFINIILTFRFVK